MLHTIIISMIFISLYANQLDNKSLRRRCDSLNGITCECANPLAFLEVNQIHIKHIPILIGLIHMRGMGFIWTTGNNGSYLNSWDSSYDSLYDEMPFWIDPTFHPYLNTTEIHCHRFVIWTRTI
uniref:Bm1658, isoform b n=1 Tax=Brugia malayi TaxID=6279 RepID=A0A1I9G6B9_BRUMA|nr:Bm1658, isoform b [Brugia malayi]